MAPKRSRNGQLICLVIGGSGLLGQEVISAAGKRGWTVRTVSRGQLDVARAQALTEAVLSEQADVIVNCAAHTNVEMAELEIDESCKINTLLPGILAAASRRCGALFVQVSSTGCYGDWKAEQYIEQDPLRPTTVHHRSKAAGEALVGQAGCRALILRTGWLYGGSTLQPKNFVWKRLEEAAKVPTILSDSSQRGNPTCVSDVAMQMLHLIGLDMTGTYNCVAHGTASRLDYVACIVAAAGLDCRVLAAPSGHFARRAPVSSNESALNYYLGLLGADVMPDWDVALRRYVGTLLPHLHKTLEA